MDAGWQRDPTGRHEHRWWDGTRWTEHVADRGVESIDPPGDAPGAVRQPPPPPAAPQAVYVERKRRRVWPWVLLGVAVVTLGGCALLAVAVNEAADELDADRRRHAISRSAFDAIPLGTPRSEVESMLVKPPANAQEFVSEGVLDESQVRSSCIYYNLRGGSFGDIFQFCFTNDILESKNAYTSTP